MTVTVICEQCQSRECQLGYEYCGRCMTKYPRLVHYSDRF